MKGHVYCIFSSTQGVHELVGNGLEVGQHKMLKLLH